MAIETNESLAETTHETARHMSAVQLPEYRHGVASGRTLAVHLTLAVREPSCKVPSAASRRIAAGQDASLGAGRNTWGVGRCVGSRPDRADPVARSGLAAVIAGCQWCTISSTTQLAVVDHLWKSLSRSRRRQVRDL